MLPKSSQARLAADGPGIDWTAVLPDIGASMLRQIVRQKADVNYVAAGFKTLLSLKPFMTLPADEIQKSIYLFVANLMAESAGIGSVSLRVTVENLTTASGKFTAAQVALTPGGAGAGNNPLSMSIFDGSNFDHITPFESAGLLQFDLEASGAEDFAITGGEVAILRLYGGAVHSLGL